MLRKTMRASRVTSDINVTPMADIMLVLLIIFMITTPLLQEDVVLNLPRAENPLDNRDKKPFVLSLTRDGRIYLGKLPVIEKEMAQALSERFANDIEGNVLVRADQALSYGNVVRVVDTCRKAGVQRVGLISERQAR